MSAQPAVLQVVILRDGLLVGTQVFVPGSFAIGSSPQADLHLDDATVAARQAMLYFQNGRTAIQDAGAGSGVYVNGHRVKACEVRAVDELAVGPFTLKLRVLTQRPDANAVPPEVAALLDGNAGEPSTRPARPPPLPPPSQAVTQPASPNPPPRSVAPAVPNSTVLSARRLAAAPVAQATPTPMAPPPQRPAPHLRAVTPLPFEEIVSTESTMTEEQVTLPIAAAAARPPQRPAEATTRRQPVVPSFEARKGRPRLFLELYWGADRREARSFGRIQPKKPVRAAADESAAFPLWGFALPDEGWVLAEEAEAQNTYRLYLPPSAKAERWTGRGFAPLSEGELKSDGQRRYLLLENGRGVRLLHGQMSLVAYVQPPQKRPFANPFARVSWLTVALLALFGTGFGYFLVKGPKPHQKADFIPKDVAPVAVRLLAPEPKKKEEAKKIAKALKERAEALETPATKQAKKALKSAPPAVAQNKALKAIQKLSAGPAVSSLFSTDKLGGGPGVKGAKEYKLSGLIGTGSAAMGPGTGTFGLGGGGKGGFGTKGAEQFRGFGGASIGALGAGGVGKGKVGGTVAKATARSVGVQGTIDREAVAKTVNAHLNEIHACYERALLKEPGLAGKVVLEWTISTGGKVVAAKTKTSTLRNAAVEGCILQKLKTWSFPPAKGGVVIVTYPFMFNSVGY